MTQSKITPTQAVDLLTAIIVSSGGNPEDYFLSSKNVNRQKAKVNRSTAEEKRESWVAPEYPIILWDEKKIERQDETENCMAVLVCGDERAPQHLGSVLLGDGRGETVAREVKNLAEKWGVGEGGRKPCMTLWDTAASNSGTVNLSRINPNGHVGGG